jgi:hypothetical protein
MSSDPFELLGLDRTTATEADVRRAYAERLKVTRPEDDRAGFMALRAAFEHARESVRWREQYGEDDPYDDYEEDDDESGAPQTASSETHDGALTLAPDPEPEPAYEPEPQDTDEQAFEARIDRAMDRLVDLLTATGFEPDLKTLRARLEDNEVAGIDEFQALQWRVRQLLCDRTGYNLEPQQIRRPLWLTLEVFDMLDHFYGWTTQPTTHPYVRRLNDWLAKVRTDIAWYAAPQKARKQAILQELSGADKHEQGSLLWLGAAGGILGYALFQFFTRHNGG